MKKALVGYGGHAKEVMAQMGIKLTCFVDDKYVVYGTRPLSEFDPKEYALMIAVADSKDRFDIVQKLPKETKYFTWVHPTVLIMDNNVNIGEGSFIGAYSILTTNINIGKHSILNRNNHIGHDCVIGDYFSAMPGSIVSGNVSIGNRVYFGVYCVWSAHTGTGDMNMSGLPFTSSGSNFTGVSIRYSNLTCSAGYICTPIVADNNTVIVFQQSAVGVAASALGQSLDVSADVIMAGHYFIA
jgi:hypothetical protein